MRRPRQYKAKASIYAAIIVAMVPVFAVGLLVCVVFCIETVVTWRGGAGKDFVESISLAIIIVWVLACCVLIPWSWTIAIRVWRRVARPIGAECCVQCGYDLSGAVGRTRDCPECGRRNWKA